MKHQKSPGAKCKLLAGGLAVVLACMLFFNCSEMRLSPWNCIEDGDYECEQYGDTQKLHKKPTDIVIVMGTSKKGRELNPKTAVSLEQFLKCIKPADWRVGIISGTEEDSSSQNPGSLMSLEIAGEQSKQKFITRRTKNYEKVFFNTVSLKSGCSKAPYCGQGANTPLNSIKTFMQKEGAKRNKQNGFLRSYAPLSVILISSTDEEKGVSNSKTTARLALSAVGKYYKDDFTGLVVTDMGKTNDCIQTTREVLSTGMKWAGKIGVLAGLVTLNPWISFGSHIFTNTAGKFIEEKDTPELIKFAQNTAGAVFDICKNSFGAPLAYNVLKKIDMEDALPNECNPFKNYTKKTFKTTD